jgi:DnaK suppressor protein
MAEGKAGDDVGEFEGLLRQRYQELWTDIERELKKHEGQRFADLVEQRADPDDRAVADLLVDLNLSEIERDVNELRAIEFALGRVKSGSYGVCSACGKSIHPDRLRVIPETPLCIDCQSRAERHSVSTPSL